MPDALRLQDLPEARCEATTFSEYIRRGIRNAYQFSSANVLRRWLELRLS